MISSTNDSVMTITEGPVAQSNTRSRIVLAMVPL